MNKFAKISAILATLAIVALPVVAQAVTSYTVENVGGQIGLGSADLKTTVIKIIQWVLGILALVAVVMIIWGGIQWMTAAGNEERVEKAKKIISAAVIGLIIILLAWAIVIFVAGTTANVTRTA